MLLLEVPNSMGLCTNQVPNSSIRPKHSTMSEKKGVDVVSVVQQATVMTLESPLISAIPLKFDAHSYEVGMLAGGTSGGQVYVWTLS